MANTKIPKNLNSRPIIALHGTASTGQQWQSLRKAYSGYREVISPNLPGYGCQFSPPSVGLTARLQPMLNDFIQLNHPVHLVGHSFGGALALRLAEIFPNKCLSVTVYEPTSLDVFRQATDQKGVQLLNEIQTLATKVTNASPLQAMALFINFWMGKGHWQSLRSDAQQQLAQYATITAQDFKDGLFEVEYPSEYQPYSGPVRLIFGDKTVEIAKHMSHLLAGKLPNASLLQLNGLGHMGPIQNPAAVNQAIMQHVEGIHRN
ncbi:alpha/beta hydrolase [Aliiglaciecola sp. 2_MG-2023]|uniref:alpha/beta fold hydrolase n=1 Tax=unclassified Aliiglaciecola TaxID=2593648 RepID=UPI0026E1D80B|nr:MULTISPECIES: alpha/beta hydrolase [unclassified Aliiglaciecola]MDO6710880.1 alpha/beta hydrolase [Aliiglaciecola sp. 2_MG-2023]MDO6752361.1 alpha/beta hydrolase [Aliiglaciecola sp. 1_MG-2023]